MLGTDPQAPPDGAQFGADVSAQDVGGAGGGWEQACQDGPVDRGVGGPGVRGCLWTIWTLSLAYSHGGGLSCSIVSQEGGDLSLIETQGQAIHRKLLPMPVDLDKVLDVDPGFNMGWLFLHAHC